MIMFLLLKRGGLLQQNQASRHLVIYRRREPASVTLPSKITQTPTAVDSLLF